VRTDFFSPSVVSALSCTFVCALLDRCLLDWPKTVSPNPDSPKLGFRVRV